MSAKVMGQIWDLDLPHAEAWVLMALADHADHDGANAFPGQDLLAWKTGYSKRQVRRVLGALERKKIIIPEGGGRGRGRTSRYRIILKNAPLKADILSAFSSSKRGQNVRSKADKMSSFSSEKRTSETQKADILSTEKRTSETQKADILNTAHDKERARVNRHEPSIEPSERESTLSAIDDLSNALCSLYRIPENAGWKLRDKFQGLAVELNGVGATLVEVQTFYADRQRKPGVEFFVSDFVAWRASQNGNGSSGAPVTNRPPVVTAPPDYMPSRRREEGD